MLQRSRLEDDGKGPEFKSVGSLQPRVMEKDDEAALCLARIASVEPEWWWS